MNSLNDTNTVEDTGSTSAVFRLKYPFDFRGATYQKFEMRRPKLRDLKKFSKEVEKDTIVAMERLIADLCEIPEVVISELDLADFSPMKAKVESFLQAMASESDES